MPTIYIILCATNSARTMQAIILFEFDVFNANNAAITMQIYVNIRYFGFGGSPWSSPPLIISSVDITLLLVMEGQTQTIQYHAV